MFEDIDVFNLSWLWWCTPVIPTLGRNRKEDCEFKANLGYIMNFSLSLSFPSSLTSSTHPTHFGFFLFFFGGTGA
jgi:hypothetical protein